MKAFDKRPTGLQLPVGGRDRLLLARLLEPLVHVPSCGCRPVVLVTAEEKQARYGDRNR